VKRRVTLLAIAALLLIIGGTATWVLCTGSGLRFAVARAEGLLAPKLAIDAVDGAASRSIHVRGVHWRDAESGVDATLAEGDVELGLRALLSGTLHLQRVDLQGLRVTLSPAPAMRKISPVTPCAQV